MATVIQPQRRPLMPFRMATRQRHAQIPIASGSSFSANGSFYAEIPKTGLLESIYLQFSGTMTLSTTGTLKVRAPWDLINNISVRLNVGSATLYSTTGFGNYVLQRTLRRDLDPTADSSLYAAPVASGDNTWTLTYYIPVAANRGKNFLAGLINLQAPEVVCTLEGSYGAGDSLVTNFSSLSGSISAGYVYYELPDFNVAEAPPPMLHRTMESRQIITAAGDQTILIPREGILHRLIHIVERNDALEDTVDNFRLLFNKADTVYYKKKWQAKYDQQYYYGGLPDGCYVWELWGAEGAPAEGDDRDMISSEALTTLESVLYVSSAPSGTLNAVDTIREFTQIFRV